RAGEPGAGDLSWHLHGLGVLPSARGRGLGEALTAAATAAGLDAGCDWLSLGMYASNSVARRLYERLGYVVEGRFTTYQPVVPPTDESPCA
ncbi:GNAT family N-acetyltransferase, partial [Actinotalea sp.]|uniref:GNAT family N-acetyltransferase n=1 Tax=Actinotalea sp. TaxID=1872145 RepID=UPI003569FACB